MSPLEQNSTRKEQVKKVPELDKGNKSSKEYKVEAIRDSVVHARESEFHLLSLYHLVVWKG